MKIILFILAYIVISSAAIAGIVFVECKMDSTDGRYLEFCDFGPHIIFGFLWPITLIPCMAYFGARYFAGDYCEHESK